MVVFMLLLVLANAAALILTGCYAHAWRQMKVTELPRYFAATAMAVAVLTLWESLVMFLH